MTSRRRSSTRDSARQSTSKASLQSPHQHYKTSSRYSDPNIYEAIKSPKLLIAENNNFKCKTCDKVYKTEEDLSIHSKFCKEFYALNADKEEREIRRKLELLKSSQKKENYHIICSDKDQFTYGGKSACTTIALEAAIYLLHEPEVCGDVLNWTPRIIDEIVNSGCMQDPQRGNLSFQEAYAINIRFQKHLQKIAAFQDSTDGDAFVRVIKEIQFHSLKRKTSVCGVITRQPETILLYHKYNTENNKKLFIIFDSHRRSNLKKERGAALLIFTDSNTLLDFLTNEMFPHYQWKNETTGLDSMYNMYSCTFITLKEGVEFERFEAIDMSYDVWSPYINDSSTDALEKEIIKLKEQLKEKDKQLSEANEKIKEYEHKIAYYKTEYEALLNSFSNIQEKASETIDKFRPLLSSMQQLEESLQKNKLTILKKV